MFLKKERDLLENAVASAMTGGKPIECVSVDELKQAWEYTVGWRVQATRQAPMPKTLAEYVGVPGKTDDRVVALHLRCGVLNILRQNGVVLTEKIFETVASRTLDKHHAETFTTWRESLR